MLGRIVGSGEGKGKIFEIAPYLIFIHIAVNRSKLNIHSLGDGSRRQYKMGKTLDLSEVGKTHSCEELRMEIYVTMGSPN